MRATAGPVKTERTEEFPVASLVLAPKLREAVVTFYRFVRRADDIADAADLPPATRLAQLQTMATSLDEPSCPDGPTAALLDVDRRFGTGRHEAAQLLSAFQQDCRQTRYRDWDDLLAYCRLSAVPVGRFLLRLHRESAVADAPADALCIALQVLNHLQDMPADRRLLDRVYLPTPWLDRAGGERRFFEPVHDPDRHAVIHAALDQVDALLDVAASLPAKVADRRLRLQARATLASAHLLGRRLRERDPLEHSVRLTKADKLGRILPLTLTLPTQDEILTERIVRRSGTSFRFGIRMLKGERRRALHAVYAFCRVADDLADGAAPAAERSRFIDGWRREIDRLPIDARTPIGRELARAVERFALPIEELHRLLDGLALDAGDRVRLQSEDDLTFYWRAVAGSVGLLSVRIFGAKLADPFALALARALQLVNILRDVVEDARRDRIYLPLARLERLGIADGPALAMIAAPGFGQAWLALADEAEEAFGEAERLLPESERPALKPAVMMLWSYRPLLVRMRAGGWNMAAPRARLRSVEKVKLAWRAAQAGS